MLHGDSSLPRAATMCILCMCEISVFITHGNDAQRSARTGLPSCDRAWRPATSDSARRCGKQSCCPQRPAFIAFKVPMCSPQRTRVTGPFPWWRFMRRAVTSPGHQQPRFCHRGRGGMPAQRHPTSVRGDITGRFLAGAENGPGTALQRFFCTEPSNRHGKRTGSLLMSSLESPQYGSPTRTYSGGYRINNDPSHPPSAGSTSEAA